MIKVLKGFSITKQLFVENLQEKSLIFQEIVHSDINSNKIKVQECDIASDFLKSYRLANSSYITTSEKVKKQKDECYFILCIMVWTSLSSKTPLPSFLPSPLLNIQTVQAPFLGNPLLYISFSWTPAPKSQIF